MGEAKRRKAKDPNYGKTPLLPLAFFELVSFLQSSKNSDPYLSPSDLDESWDLQIARGVVRLFNENPQTDFLYVSRASGVANMPKGYESGFVIIEGDAVKFPPKMAHSLKALILSSLRDNYKVVVFVKNQPDGACVSEVVKLPKENLLGGIPDVLPPIPLVPC